MVIERFVKTILVFFIALFCLSVAMDNIIDYEINFNFLKHVISMDTMRPWIDTSIPATRGISKPTIHTLIYHAIIASEFIAGFLALFSAAKMLYTIKHDKAFAKSKQIYAIAAALMLSIWYFGFNVIAANWFYMWANTNGVQETSYSFSIFILLSLMYVMRSE